MSMQPLKSGALNKAAALKSLARTDSVISSNPLQNAMNMVDLIKQSISDPAQRTISVNSAAMPQLLGQPALSFYSLSGQETLSQLFDYSLILRTPDSNAVPLTATANIDVKPMIGQIINVNIEVDGMGEAAAIGAGSREVNGIITRAGFLRREGDFHLYQLSVRPWLWLATLTSDFKTFQNRSVLQIVEELLADYPYPIEMRLDKQKYKLDTESPNNEHRFFQVQYGESDYQFFQRLVSEYGIYWYFIHEQGHHRLILCDGVGGHQPSSSPAYHTVPYQPQAGKTDQEYLYQFSLNETMRPGRVVVKDFDFTKPLADLSAVSQQPRPHPLNEAERFLWPGDYSDSKHGDLISRVRMEQIRASGCRAQATGNIRGLACGYLFSLSDHQNVESNQEYLILGSQLSLEDIGEESGKGQRYLCTNQLLLQPSSEVYRPPLQKKPHTHGPQTATVVGPTGKEIWTDEFGRVRLKFNWDRYAQGNEQDSCWVRVSQAWAGKGFGGIYIPRIGQEVIVDFINGDPDRPLVIGSLYNTQVAPPWGLPGSATQSGMMSRSMEGGPSSFNALRFEDKKGGEEVMLQAQKDMNSLIKDKETHTVGTDRTRKVGQNETVYIGKDRTATITENDTLTVGKEQTTTITEGQTVSVGKEYLLEAGDKITLRCGEAVLVMDKAGNISLNGQTILQTAVAGFTAIGAPVNINPGDPASTAAGEVPVSEVEAVAIPAAAAAGAAGGAAAGGGAGQKAQAAKAAEPFPPGVKEGLQEQKKMLDDKKASLERWNEQDQAKFKEAFGTADEASRQKILSAVNKQLDLNAAMTPSNFARIDPAVADPESTYAYVYRDDKDHKIYLGKLFDNAPLIGQDSKAGTLAHEMSHFNDILGTRDHMYGRDNCLQLAIDDPIKAISNADNFEMFLEKP
ncbi:type VI secretion system tip protein VgrG [Neisseriaceae bacterium TC5R-5]|nr:type VI secretion system tip protein VgrG [Neisseriaceae bacterium TC5R-5]